MIKIVDVYKDESSYVPVEPVLLPEVKAWLLVDYPDDDALLTVLITRSRAAIEDFCHISIVPKTIFLTAEVGFKPTENYGNINRWDRSFYGVPDSANMDWSELPYGPVSAVQSVTTLDNNQTLILANGTDYFLRGKGFIQMKLNQYSQNALIQYTTPYYCPNALKEAILNEIAFRYKNRGDSTALRAGNKVDASEGAQYLAQPFQRIWL